jgi:hypothetical protein
MDLDGLVHWEITEGRYDQAAYLSFVRRMTAKLDPQDKIALLYDGLSVHTAKAANSVLIQELQILPILNAAYQPNCNAIEGLFSMIKRFYRRMLVDANVSVYAQDSSVMPDRYDLIREVFKKFEVRDNRALIAGAELAMEKLLGAKFERKKKASKGRADFELLLINTLKHYIR